MDNDTRREGIPRDALPFMDLENDEPKLSVNVHRRTTQLNLWMIVAVVVFFLAGGFIVLRLLNDPPSSTEEMKEGSRQPFRKYDWVSRAC